MPVPPPPAAPNPGPTPGPPPGPDRAPSGWEAPPPAQRRAHYRAGDDQPVLVQLVPGPDAEPVPAAAFVVRLSDLSESGVRLRVEPGDAALLPLGAEVGLVVSLPDSNEDLRGRVVHRDAPEADGSVGVGVAFVAAPRPATDRIRRHVFRVQREALARRRTGPAD